MADDAVKPPTVSDPYRIHFRVLAVVLVAFFTNYGVDVVRHSIYKDPKPNETLEEAKKRPHGSDFTAYYSAGELARKGENIYDYRASSTPVRPYIYPAMFAVFPMAPLSLFSHNTAVAVFFVLNLVLLAAGLWLVWKVLVPPTSGTESIWRRPELGCLFAVAVCWQYLHSNLRGGNANLYCFFCLALALYLFTDIAKPPEVSATARRSWLREFFSGIVVALATTFKLTPGLFGVYFFWTFRRWAMLGGAVGLALFLLFVPALLLGFSKNWTALKVFTEHARDKAMADEDDTPQEILIGRPKKAANPDELPRAVGISFRGTLMKMLSETEALTRDDLEGDRSVNIMNLEPKQAQTAADILALVLLLATVVLTFPAWTRAGALPIALSWSLTTTAMVLVAPLTRMAHLVVLLIPVSVLIVLLQQSRLRGAAKTLAWAALFLLGCGGGLTSKAIWGSKLSQTIQALGLTTWSTLLLFIALAVALWQLRPNPSASEATS